MRKRSVLGFKPRRSAALPGPLIFQPHSSSTATMCARSISASEPALAAATGAWSGVRGGLGPDRKPLSGLTPGLGRAPLSDSLNRKGR